MSEFELLIEYETEGNPTKDERVIIEAVKLALNDNSPLKDLYLSFGSTVRHRIMNLNHYYHNLNYGFTHKDLNEYNWLIRGDFEIEKIEFETTHTNHNPYIEIGKSPNGKYSFGWSYSTGGNGSGSPLHTFREPINSRKEMFDYAIAHAQKWFTEGLNRNDSTNFNEALINQVLKSIEKIKIDQTQLQLF
jgi:hypothetical protein